MFIFKNYDISGGPIGCIEVFDNFPIKDFCKNWVLAPGYVRKSNGKVELIEVSLIPYKSYDTTIDKKIK